MHVLSFPAHGYHGGNFTLANAVGTLIDEVNELQPPDGPRRPVGRLTIWVSSATALRTQAMSSNVSSIAGHG
jgi:hypothetical protein